MIETIQTNGHIDSERLSAFVDGEGSGAELRAIQQHLEGCHACTLRVLSAMQLKAATARAGHRYAATPEALARMTAAIRTQTMAQRRTEPTRRVRAVRPMVWGALAAALALFAIVLGGREVRQSNALTAELLDQHLATLSNAAAPQVISSDRHTVKPWFQGKLPFSFNLPEPSALPPDAVLKGADLSYLHGQPVALLLFAIHRHEVSVFVTQRTTSPVPAVLPSAREGFTIRSATTADLRMVAVSDVNAADLDLLVAALVRAQ